MKKIILFFIDATKKFRDDDAFSLASHVTLYSLLSFFPFLIFLLTLVSFSPLNGEYVITEINSIIPSAAVPTVNRVLREILIDKNFTLLSFSFILTLWSASSGFKSIMLGLNRGYHTRETRPYLKVKLICMLYTIVFALVIILSAGMLLFGEKLVNYIYEKFNLSYSSFTTINLLRITIVVSIVFTIFLFLYRYCTSIKPPFSSVAYGALFSTCGLYLTTLLFGIYINNFANKYLVYGSIGGVYVMIVWINVISMIILFGGELNALIYQKYYNFKK